jgi:hypothetical protein
MVKNKGLSFIEFINGAPIDLLYLIRTEILKGFKLITHPLSSSLKPNFSPYKTVFLTLESENGVDDESLHIIEKAIEYTEDLMKNQGIPNWDKESLKDFQLVDLDLIKDLF